MNSKNKFSLASASGWTNVIIVNWKKKRKKNNNNLRIDIQVLRIEHATEAIQWTKSIYCSVLF